MWRQSLTGWSGTKRQKSNAVSATNSTATAPVFQSPGESATVPALTDTVPTEGTAAEGTIAEGATAEGTFTTVVDGAHKRSTPADPLQTTEDITLDAKGKKLVRDCYDGLESAQELPRSKAMFNSSFLTAARKSWLHVACLGYRNWERLFCALCMRTHEPPAKKGRDVFWRGQARTDEDKLKLHEQSKLHLENACFKKDSLTLHAFLQIYVFCK